MNCPFCSGQPDCDYELECEALAVALDETEELRVVLNAEVNTLRLCIRQLEKYIAGAGLPRPPKAF